MCRKFAGTAFTDVTEAGQFAGYASLFDVVDLGQEAVAPGAFAASLGTKGPDGIRMLFQHDPGEPIGHWVEIREDDRGLRVCGRIDTNVARGREVLSLMQTGGLDGLSIGFKTVRATSDRATGVRRILEADLWEISVVTFPMLPQARIAAVKASTARAKVVTPDPTRWAASHGPWKQQRFSATRKRLDPALPSVREFEHWLVRNAGLTRRQARTVITRGYAAIDGERDAASNRTAQSGRELVLAVRRATRLLNDQTKDMS